MSELTVLKNNEIHIWDRGYDDDGQQVSPYVHLHFWLFPSDITKFPRIACVIR